ncbi:MAG TPA: hypothetical protein VGF55_10755, partial [Gemmataceae bacterium]
LDVKQMVAKRKIRPDKAAESRLFKKVKAGEMPPEDEKPRPTPAEIDALEAWINAGAPDFSEPAPPAGPPPAKPASDGPPPAKPAADEPAPAAPAPARPGGRPFVSEKDALVAVRDHLRGLTDAADQPFQRYFTLTHLHNNPAVSDDDLRWQRAALAKAVNSLSWKPRIVVPRPLDKAETVFVVDVRELDWDRRRVWEEVSKHYPYGLKLDGQRDDAVRSVAAEVYRLSGSDLPVLRADWFVATATRPPLYHTVLDLPDTAAKLEKLLRVDVTENFQRDKLARAGFAKSGVSSQNRLIERHEAAYGAYWKSFDFKNNDGTGNLFQFPLGPVFKDNPFAAQAFQHAGGELIFHLPNGLQGYLLVDAKGKRIDEGPTEIVSDTNKTSGTVAVVNGVSCMACHKHGMIREGFKDELREGAGVAGAAQTKLFRLHPKADDFNALMKDDEDRFVAALDKSAGRFLKVGTDQNRDIRDFTDEPIGRVVRAYNRDLGLAEVAAELGLADPRRLAAAVNDNVRLKQEGLGSLANGGTVKRDAWASPKGGLSPFQRAASILDRGAPHLPF